MTETYSNKPDRNLGKGDGRKSKTVNFAENVLQSKHLLKRNTSNVTTSTEYADHLLIPYDETCCNHLLGLRRQVSNTGVQVGGHAAECIDTGVVLKIGGHRSQLKLGKVGDRSQVNLGKGSVKRSEEPAKMREIAEKNHSIFKFPSKKHSNVKFLTKYDSKLGLKVPNSAETRRTPILSKQCVEKSHEKLFERGVEDHLRESVVDLQSIGFVMITEETKQSERATEDDHFHSLSSSIYSLFRSPPLSYLNPSSSKDNTLDDTSSVILGLGDLNELREAESILSFDGDLQKIPYYRQLIHSDEMSLSSTS
ncbi:hypothetical protein WDU94_008608 [Cyamophila willieti]